MSISAVGTLASSDAATLAVDPQTVGDLMVVFALGTSGVPVLSGGGVTTWTLDASVTETATGFHLGLYHGVVTTSGAETISATGGAARLDCQEYTGGGSGTWTTDTEGTTKDNVPPMAYPTLAPAGSGELYVGHARSSAGDTISSGGTAGCVYVSYDSGVGQMVYDLDVTTSLTPAATVSAGGWTTAAALYVFTSSGGDPVTSEKLDLTGTLNALAGTSNLGKQAAANIWAGLPSADGLDLVGALNVKAGNGRNPSGWRGLGAVCNQLAGTSNLEPLQALQSLLGS